MLSENISELKSKLNNLIAENNSPVYDAAYNAYYTVSETMLKEKLKDAKNDINDEDLKTKFDDEPTKEYKEQLSDESKIFANAFCKGLKDGGFMDAIADGIDSHIRKMTLTITMMPQGIATIISPMGPCTGSMVINDSTAQIQIL